MLEIIHTIKINDTIVRRLGRVEGAYYAIFDENGEKLHVSASFEDAWEKYPRRFDTEWEAEQACIACAGSAYLASDDGWYVCKSNSPDEYLT